VTIRPPHPESEASKILELHRKVTERIDRQRTQGPLNEHLEAASADLDEVARVSVIDGTGQSMLAHVVARTLAAAPGGPRAGNLDGNGGSLRTDDEGFVILRSDPTGDAAMQLDDGARDRREMMHQLESINRYLLHYDEIVGEHAKIVRRCADRFVCLCLNWLPRRADNSVKAKADTEAPDGCHSCARVGSWSPIHRTWRQGQLGQGIPLCRPCYERALTIGALPPKADVDRMVSTGKMPRLRESA